MNPFLKKFALLVLAANAVLSQAASQISDGQVQAASATRAPVAQISDGQLQVPITKTVTTTVSTCPASSASSKAPVSTSSSLPGVYNAQDKNGAVASESAVCSRIGIDILKAGGNAADALVATVLCIGVIGMYHSG